MKLLVLLVAFAVSWYCVSGVLRGLVQLLFRATVMLREKEKKVELPRSWRRRSIVGCRLLRECSGDCQGRQILVVVHLGVVDYGDDVGNEGGVELAEDDVFAYEAVVSGNDDGLQLMQDL